MDPAPRDRLVIGCMSGTSADGVDAAAVRVRGTGLEASFEPLGLATVAYGPLAERVRSLQRGHPHSAGEICSLSRELALLHVRAVVELSRQHGAPDLVSMHGQTVFHAPPLSWQLCSPSTVAAGCDCDVISDLRAADLAEGGEGAPITPLSDWLTMRDRGAAPVTRVILNLGGFCNATILPAGGGPESVIGLDACLCNQLLDHACQQRTGDAFDQDGARALSGSADSSLRDRLAEALAAQASAGRSLGTAHEQVAMADQVRHLGDADALATLSDAIAAAIVRVVHGRMRSAGIPAGASGIAWHAAGGGVRHGRLMRQLGEQVRGAGGSLHTTAALGVDPAAREAIAMAALGSIAADGSCITLTAVTGRASSRLLDGTLARSNRIFTLQRLRDRGGAA